MKIGETILRVMKERGLKQAEIARLCGITSGVVNDLIKGRRDSVSLETLKQIAVGLEVSADELLFGRQSYDDLGYIYLVKKFEAEGISREQLWDFLEWIRKVTKK